MMYGCVSENPCNERVASGRPSPAFEHPSAPRQTPVKRIPSCPGCHINSSPSLQHEHGQLLVRGIIICQQDVQRQ
jgi:hypothetical protein